MSDRFSLCEPLERCGLWQTAAERRKICSPRREPWGGILFQQPQSGETASRTFLDLFRPCRGSNWFAVYFPRLTPWATDLSPLRGYGEWL